MGLVISHSQLIMGEGLVQRTKQSKKSLKQTQHCRTTRLQYTCRSLQHAISLLTLILSGLTCNPAMCYAARLLILSTNQIHMLIAASMYPPKTSAFLRPLLTTAQSCRSPVYTPVHPPVSMSFYMFFHLNLRSWDHSPLPSL